MQKINLAVAVMALNIKITQNRKHVRYYLVGTFSSLCQLAKIKGFAVQASVSMALQEVYSQDSTHFKICGRDRGVERGTY